MNKPGEPLPSKSSKAEVDAFLGAASATPAATAGGSRGRLLFALDATASREPTWDCACEIQARMFEETARLGGLDVQLCYYRGFREFDASRWLDNARGLLSYMREVRCAGGQTQIAKVLRHAVSETRRRRINAMVFVGDCMEESADTLCELAGQLRLLGVPIFLFHEGADPVAERAFREMARLTHGAYCAFDASSGDQLRDLLSAVAVYAAGGYRALEDFSLRRGGVVPRLAHQLGERSSR